MSYTQEDYERDMAYESISEELNPEHKLQAIEEFTNDKLRSYYLSEPKLLYPAAKLYKQAEKLLADKHFSASLIFAASSVELFLKNSLLKPIIFGQINNGQLANLIVDSALSQTGFKRYEKLISAVFIEITGNQLEQVKGLNPTSTLLSEAKKMQESRNRCLHSGENVSELEAKEAVQIAHKVFTDMVYQIIVNLDLDVVDNFLVARTECG